MTFDVAMPGTGHFKQSIGQLDKLCTTEKLVLLTQVR